MRWLIALVFCSFSTHGLAETMSVEMRCAVKEQTVLQSNDGQAKEYSSLSGEFSKGDTLLIAYGITDADKLDFSVVDLNQNKAVIETKFGPTITEPHGKVQVYDKVEPNALLYNGKLRYFSSSENDVNYRDTTKDLLLIRYYKSDFHGILVRSGFSPPAAEVSALDCRMVKNEFDQILAAFE